MRIQQTEATWKRALKCGISLALFGVSAIVTFLVRLIGKGPQTSCVVLYYHSVPADERSQFANQLDIMLHHATPIGVTGKLALRPGIHHVGLTFDDGFENFVRCALPELEMRQIPATVFVISDTIGKTFGVPGHPERVMSLEQMRTLPKNLITIGSHTLSHPFLPSISEQLARLEICGSRVHLEESLDRKILLFSFPFGGFNDKLIDLCRGAGYERVFTTVPTFVSTDPEAFVVGRVRVDPTDWKLEFRLKLAGAYRWEPHAWALKRMLLFRRERSVLSRV